MRLWSINPKFLDTIGLIALWREALLAKKVLSGNTKGYKNHPQLDRFKSMPDPIMYLNNYLCTIYGESLIRGFKFDFMKVNPDPACRDLIKISSGQLLYEFEHLQNKLKIRNPKKFEENEECRLKFGDNYQFAYLIKNERFQQTNNDSIEKWEKL